MCLKVTNLSMLSAGATFLDQISYEGLKVEKYLLQIQFRMRRVNIPKPENCFRKDLMFSKVVKMLIFL